MPTNPDQWTFPDPAISDSDGRLVQTPEGHLIRMTIDPPAAPGDGTVPADASGAQIATYTGCRIACALEGFEHQGDYNNDAVRAVLLDALIRLIEPVEVTP